MALSKAVAEQYFRQSAQQQVLYAYWLAFGDLARARLAMDVANWYYQQLGIPLYLPSDLIGYAPHPTTPDAADAIAATLPVDAGGPAIAGSGSAGSGSGSGSAGSGFKPHDVSSGFGGDAPVGSAQYCILYPEDPICSGGGYNYGLGGGIDSGPITINNPVNITINQNGATLADVTSRISGALATAAAAIVTAENAALAAAIAGIQHALNAIGNELASVFHLLSRLAGYVLGFLKTLLKDVVHALVAAVDAIGKMLKDVFAHGIIPALQALQRLRDYLLKIYERYLRPLLIVLQDLRKVLAILKAFHVGFATKLDNVLADIQSKLSTPLLYLLRYTNAIANYINLILDARLFLQRPLFLASANANKGSLLNLLINAMNPTPDPAAVAALQATAVIPTPAESQNALKQFLTNGSGPMAASIAQNKADAQRYLVQGL